MGRTSNARERLMRAVVDLMWERSYGSVTIDAICQRANVKKGSFYYFFESKSDLSVSALEFLWEWYKPVLDAAFSPSLKGLERVYRQMDEAWEFVREDVKTYGKVRGDPFFSIGSEVCCTEPKVTAKVREILERYRRYFESAVRDAIVDGAIEETYPEEAARCLFNLYQGMLTQARIQNNGDLLRDLKPAAQRILGLRHGPPVGA